jgi:hypothetical protein
MTIDAILRILTALLLTLVSPSPSVPPDTATQVRGLATWYDAPSKQDAAAGPALRRFLGRDWRGSWVRVMRGSATVTVILTDWCACGSRHGQPTLLDLDDQAYRELAPLSSGVVTVRVERIDGVPTRLPNTDTEVAP